uniref:4-coumarate--CoA ligase 1-like n=1 Tax=Rhabditophanes sp. KR3021 TaxID=114890 RepID=A0AC35TQ63_9BILA
MIFKSIYKSVPIASKPFHETVLNQIWEYSKEFPNKPCFVYADDDSVQITYKQVYLNSYSVANFLEQNGFKHQDIATFVTQNCWELTPIFLGCSMRGITISGASYAFNEHELAVQFNDSSSKVVFTAENTLQNVLKAVKKSPTVRMIVVIDSSKKAIDELPFGIIKFSDVLAITPVLTSSVERIDIEKDVLILPYSSGTTGAPKGVMLSHKNFGSMMKIVQTHFVNVLQPKMKNIFDSWKTESVILFLPFYHIYGLGSLFNALLNGSTGIIMRQFDQNIFCKVIEQYKVKILMVVPPILVFLAKHPITKNYDLTSIKYILSGAAPCGKDLIDEVKKKFPDIQHIGQGYGMTEVSMASSFDPFEPQDNAFSSVGRLACNLEMRIVDPDTEQDQDYDGKGEIWIRGPTVMLGYLNKLDQTDAMVDKDGWLRTGDIGLIDKRNNIYIVDRIKELIKVKGLQVPPAEIEDILLSHPQVQDVAVIGIPDAEAGELPKAFVVRNNKKLTEKDIYDFVAGKLAKYKHLRGGVEFIDEIPKSPAGKILRRLLRDRGNNKSKI